MVWPLIEGWGGLTPQTNNVARCKGKDGRATTYDDDDDDEGEKRDERRNDDSAVGAPKWTGPRPPQSNGRTKIPHV